MWAYESVFYQIYPLGFCGAPFENDGVLEHRILKVNDWIPHIKACEKRLVCGIDAHEYPFAITFTTKNTLAVCEHNRIEITVA